MFTNKKAPVTTKPSRQAMCMVPSLVMRDHKASPRDVELLDSARLQYN